MKARRRNNSRSESAGQKYICDICNRIHDDEEALILHRKVKHNLQNDINLK